MDDLDQQIISALQKDARVPFLQLAKNLKVSEGTIRNRVFRLQKQRIIRNFTVNLTTEASAFVEITTDPRVSTTTISQKIKELGIDQVYELAGRITIVCLLRTKGLSETNDLVEAIRNLDGVQQTETFPILKVV